MFRLFCYWFVGDSRHSTCPRRLLIMVSVEPYFFNLKPWLLYAFMFTIAHIFVFNRHVDSPTRIECFVLLQILLQFRLSYNIRGCQSWTIYLSSIFCCCEYSVLTDNFRPSQSNQPNFDYPQMHNNIKKLSLIIYF